jgi:hypothetical protein
LRCFQHAWRGSGFVFQWWCDWCLRPARGPSERGSATDQQRQTALPVLEVVVFVDRVGRSARMFTCEESRHREVGVVFSINVQVPVRFSRIP